MRGCPYCGTPIKDEGTKGTMTSEFGGKMSKKKAMGFLCERCGRSFATIRGRGEEVVISTRIQEKMRMDLDKEKALNATLKKKVTALVAELRSSDVALKRVKETAYIRSLQIRLHELQPQVEYLRREKARLERELALA